MTERDPLDALFEAARKERPDERVRARTKQLVRSASRGIHAVTTANARRDLRSFGLPALGLGLAIAAAALALTISASRPATPSPLAITPETIEPEPRQPVRDSSPAPEAPSEQPAARAPVQSPARAIDAERKPAPATPKPAPTLAQEIAILDQARAALAARDGARVLALVDEYERELSGTRMRAEAALLRIEALAQRGDRARAAQLARRFTKEHAGNPLADRARALSAIDQPLEGEPR